MDVIDKLTEIFKEFPGIGERQARRFVYFLMAKNGDYAASLTKLVAELKKEVSQCESCFRFFLGGQNGKKICGICTDPGADTSTLLVLEKDSDLESMRKSGAYRGMYFLLGGLVPIVEKTTKSRVRIEELKKRVKTGKPKEVILAFSLSPQGDHTESYVRSELADIAKELGIKISTLGRGLSTGTELEYSDTDTLKNALKNRQ
ncbi:MAG TPA: toprim domain-containing protein [Candidatus Paceibacterota bacterium]|nr:toprim domain-containing protein [Candidatus Paceibacterota bacterium]